MTNGRPVREFPGFVLKVASALIVLAAIWAVIQVVVSP
jgi:hypothetical protein